MLSMFQQPLYVNCQQYQQQPYLAPPYVYGAISPGLIYQQQPQPQSPPQQPMMQQPPTAPMPIRGHHVSPLGGRFDGGYDSDTCSSGSLVGGVSPLQQATIVYGPSPSPSIYGPSPSPTSSCGSAPPNPPPQKSIWRDQFVASFTRFPIGSWHLSIVAEPPDLHNTGFARNLWRYQLHESARVRFECPSCHSSSVGNGRAVFWIYKDDATNVGHIHLKLYGRKCAHCKASAAAAADAIWPERDACRATSALFDYVAQAYYGIAPHSSRGRSRSGASSSTTTTTHRQ